MENSFDFNHGSQLGRVVSPLRALARPQLAAACLVIAAVAFWSADAQAQIVFRETFGTVDAQLPTATSTADGNWTSAACLNGRIVAGGSPSDTTGSTRYLFHFTASCSYTAGQAVWRNVTPIPVQPNTTYIFGYWSFIANTVSDPQLTQQVTPNAGAITVDSTSTPGWGSANNWVRRTVTFTTGAATTAVNLRINNANTGGGGNDFGLDDIMLSQLPAFPGCNSTMYLTQAPTSAAPTILSRIDTSTNPFTFPTLGSAPILYNATAYQPANNYLYAIEQNTNTLIRVGSDGNVVPLGAVTNLPVPSPATALYNAGEIGADGFYYVKTNNNNNQLYRIDLATRTATPVTLDQAVGVADMAWYNGLLYGANNNVLYSIHPGTAVVSLVGAFTGASGGFGAMFGASNGIFGSANSGGFYQFDPITGAATLISGSPASTTNDGAKCASSPVTLPSDLAVTKTDNLTSYVAGQNVTYTIVVSNAGPFGVANAIVNDPLPAGISTATWTCSAGANGGVCGTPSGAGGITNALVNLPVNATVTFTLTVTVPPSFAGDLVNTVTVSAPSTTSDTNPANNVATDTDTQVTADLTISKVSTPNPYVPGAPFTYTIVASNLGPGAAPGATVSDTLPSALAGFAWTCSGSGGATCGTASGTAPTITTSANLPVGGSVTILVTGTLPSSTTGVLSNTVTITPPANVPDPVMGNNTATDVNPTGAQADLRISKASTPNPYVPGEPLTYTVVVSNAGPSDALGARVQDPLPPAFANFAWTCAAGPGAACLTASGTGDVDAFVNLPVGTTATFTSTGTVPSSYTSTATNTATIDAPPTGLTDPVPGNNTATSQNPPGPIVDLAITKGQTPDPYVPGAAIAYTLLVQNLGPSDATNARVQDVLPGSLTNVMWTCAASGTGASCGTQAGANVVDALVTLPVGTTATFTINATVVPSATGVLINTATVTAPVDVTDPVPGNNTSTVTSGPAPEVDLSVVKTASLNLYVPGTPLSFTIVVSNAGPSDALNARVQDLFPAPLSGFTWTCAPSSGAATCGTASGISVIDVLVDLPVGSAVTFTASGVVPPETTGSLTNTATVTPPVEIRDPNLTNNLSAVTLGYGPRADLRVTKTSTPNPYVPGTPITYTIVATNDGPSALFDGRVRDVVPAVLQTVTWTCSAINGTCPAPSGIGSLDASVDIGVGGTVTFIVTGDVPAQTRGVLINTATILPPPEVIDPTPNNNSVVDSNPAIVPGGPADLQITQEFPGVAPPNGLLTFRLRSRNLGSNTALNPYMTGMIPPGTTFVSVTPSAGGTCNVPGNPPAPDPVTGYPIPGAATEPLRCTWPGLMKPGDSHYMEFTVRVAPGTPTGQILWSCWWTWSETEDPYHANNVVDAYLFVDDGMSPVGDLSVQAAALSEGVVGTTLPTRVGVPVPMRFWATNHGPNATRGQYALILDTAGTLDVVDIEVAQGWVGPTSQQTAMWDTGLVQPGQTVALDLTVRLRTTASVALFAQRVTGSPGDPNASNERATIILDGYGLGAAGRWVAVGNVDGAGAGEILTGAGQGETPQVRVFTGTGADTGLRFFAYERPFRGGVQIASCDVDGNGTAELITVPGPGRASTIRVLSLVGGVVTELVAFDAFEASFTGGASVACADLDADGSAEVVVGAGPGHAPEVQVYNVGLSSIVPRATFLAYESGFLGGVRVAAGVYPGRAGWLGAFAIATTPGVGRAPELRLWTATGGPVAQVVVSSATRGVLPTLGDVNGDGQLDLVVAPDDGRPELVRIFNIDTGDVLGDVPGGLPAFPLGIRTAIGVLDGGPGQPEIVIGNGPGGHPRVRVISWPPAGPVQRLEILPLEIP